VSEGTVDVTKQIAALKAKRATAIVLIGSPRMVGVAAPQIVAAWPGVLVAGFESMDPEGLSREAREALEGASFFAPDYSLLGAPRDSFAGVYERSYKQPPTRMSVRGYLVGLAVTRALQS
jgi:ABC-type branched-subunit amino acid transport system substrate-binding protein